MKKTLLYILLALLFTSCARSYHVVNPAVYNYDNKKALSNEINVSYFYDVQNLNRNKPYARKERKKNMKLLAVKIENNSDSVVIITKENFVIKTASGRDITIIDNSIYTQAIRQYAETFVLFYGLAGIGYEWGEVNGQEYSNVTYNFIPLLIGVGNAIFASISNSNQKNNIESNQIFNKPIQPKSSFYGLIAIQESSYPELNFFYYKE